MGRVNGATRVSGHALEDVTPVRAAGVGVRRGWRWALRSASFRIAAPAPGRTVVGIAVDTQAEGTTVVDLLAGQTRPAHGDLRVLGEDMTTARGRAGCRRLRSVDWSLLGCGRSGHATYAPAEAELRPLLSAPTPAGTAWRCLRCGTFVPGEPAGSGPAAAAPDVRRGKDLRSAVILRLFAIERYLRALVFGVAAFGVWRFEYARASIDATLDREYPAVRTLLLQLGYNVDHSKLAGLVQRALTLSPASINLIAAALAAYAVIEAIEGTGLWLAKRWGEYFAMVVTSLGLPYEIYDLANKITATRVIFFVINLALVLYLVITRRLFGLRGGKSAYEARLRGESIMQTAINEAAAAGQAAGPPGSLPDGPGQGEPSGPATGPAADPAPAEAGSAPGPAADPAPAEAASPTPGEAAEPAPGEAAEPAGLTPDDRAPGESAAPAAPGASH